MEHNQIEISDFIKAVKKACAEHGTKLPEIVKNYKPGDERLYRRKAKSDKDFDMVNNNESELEIF